MSHIRSVFGTKEWAQRTANCLEGCWHDCVYCYAKSMAIRFDRKTAETWHVEVPRPDLIDKVLTGRPCRVMFPSTHDITPSNLRVCLPAIEAMLDHGHSLLIVSKPHVDCIQAICRSFACDRERILFRFTIGSSSDEVLAFWEPNAPCFMERLDSLCLAHETGFGTSVSCEPMLDGNIDAVINEVLPFVTDAVWVGKANQLRARLRINGADAEAIRLGEMLIASQSDATIRALYLRHKDNPKIKWKESIKKVIGLPIAVSPGMDI